MLVIWLFLLSNLPLRFGCSTFLLVCSGEGSSIKGSRIIVVLPIIWLLLNRHPSIDLRLVAVPALPPWLPYLIARQFLISSTVFWVIFYVLFLGPGLAGLACFGSSLTLTVFFLDVRDQALLRPVIRIRIDDCIDGLKVIGLAQWGTLLTSPMWLFVQGVVRLLVT